MEDPQKLYVTLDTSKRLQIVFKEYYLKQTEIPTRKSKSDMECLMFDHTL